MQASAKPKSVMQPQQAAEAPSGTSGAAVRSAAFAALAEQDVPVDTIFFHKYAHSDARPLAHNT